MYKPDKKLRLVQLRSLEIMKYLHSFLEDNNIKYSICGGTAIGAIVHRGFIPWDDDIDICMDRQNYNKFISLFKNQGRYVLDNYRNNSNSRIIISKVLDSHTKIVFESQYGEKLGSSIFVDVSVFDRIHPNLFVRKYQLLLSDLAMLTVNKYAPINRGELIHIISRLYLATIPKNKIKNICSKLERMVSKYEKRYDYSLSETLLNRNGNIIFPNDLFDKLLLVEFEDTKFYIFEKYDEYLTIKYGKRYEIIPDESEQYPHHNILKVSMDGIDYE